MPWFYGGNICFFRIINKNILMMYIRNEIMKTTNKLVILIAGLSLGACSSMEEKDSTFMTYEDMQSKILAHDAQWQTVQPKLDRIDELEADIAELKKENMALSKENNAMAETMVDDKNITTADASTVITPAPILSENNLNNSANKSEAMVNLKAPLAVVQPMMPKSKYGVQVASYGNRDEAIRGWNVLLKKDSASFKGLQPLINQKQVKGRTMYQLKVGPFLDKPFSADFCNMLKDKGTDCLVTQYNGDAFTVN